MTFPKGTAVLKAIAQFSGQTDSYFSSTQSVLPGERSQVPPLKTSEMQALKRSGWLLHLCIQDAAPQVTKQPNQAGGRTIQELTIRLLSSLRCQPRQLSNHPIATGSFKGSLSYFIKESIFRYLIHSLIRQPDRRVRIGAQNRKGGLGHWW